MKLFALLTTVFLFGTNSFALECKDLGNKIELKPVAIDVGDGPQPQPDDGTYFLIQPDCTNNVYNVSAYNPDDQDKLSLELTYSFSVGKVNSEYKYLRYPEINKMLYHSVLGSFVGNTLEIRDTSVQVNEGKSFPDDAFGSQEVLVLGYDNQSKKWKATNTMYNHKGVYGVTYYEQK